MRHARALGLSTLVTMWLARFSNLLAYVVIVAFALVRMPRWRGVLAIVACLSQYADGASWSLVMGGTQAVLTILIFALSIRWGEGGLSATEFVMIAIAGGGVAGWLVADEPIVATVCVIAADLVGAALMLPKTYRDPESETLVTFALASVGGALAAGAVGAVDVSLLLYPVYYCVVNAAIALLIWERRLTRAGAAAPRARASLRPAG